MPSLLPTTTCPRLLGRPTPWRQPAGHTSQTTVSFWSGWISPWVRFAEGQALLAELEAAYAGPDAEAAWAPAAHRLWFMAQQR